MTVKSLNAVYAICHFSDWDITNLQLQKILYLARKRHLGKHDAGTPLVNSRFEAWAFGPVVPHVYRERKQSRPNAHAEKRGISPPVEMGRKGQIKNWGIQRINPPPPKACKKGGKVIYFISLYWGMLTSSLLLIKRERP